LRERGGDVLLLADSMLRALCRQYGTPERTLSGDAHAWMTSYRWPGNVRELRNLLERIVLLENDLEVREEHFTRSASESDKLRPVLQVESNGRIRVSLPTAGVPFADLEREVLREALAQCEDNVSRAARYLSITRQALIYRMKKHGISNRRE
jgi:DNA-binding NtrC family response regulator